MEKEDILIINNLIFSLEKKEEEIEEYHKNRDYENLEKSKKDFMNIQKEISSRLI